MNTCGVCDVEVDGVGGVTGGLGFTRVSDGNLENFSSRGRSGCGGVGMYVGVVGGSEPTGERVFKYVLDDAAAP